MLWILAEAAAPKASPAEMPDVFAMFTPMLIVLGIFYLLLIRPQQRDQANRQAQLERLKKDDEVVTIGGLFGTVVNLTEDRQEVTLKIADNTRVRVLRSAIQSIVSNKG